MKVTMAMIFDGLSKYFTCTRGPMYVPERPVFAALELESESEIISDACFVATIKEAEQTQFESPESLIVIDEGEDESVSCAIRVSGKHSTQEVRNRIAESINEYMAWSDELLNLTIHGAGLEELIDFAHNLFENPMTIIDHNYRIIAYTEQDVMEDDLWVVTQGDLHNGDKPISLVSTEKDAKGFEFFLEQLRIHGEMFAHVTSIGTRVSARVVRVMPSGLIIVNIAEKNRSVTEGDFACLRYFSKIIGAKMRAIEHSWHSSMKSYDALLQDVVRGNLVEASEIKSRLGESWIETLPYFTVFVVDSRQGFARYHELCAIEDEISERFPEARCVIHARTLVVFVNHESPLVHFCIEDFRHFLKLRSLMAGMSDSCGIEVSLHDLVDQAQMALRIGRKQFPDEIVVPFAQCRIFYLFDLCCRCGEQDRFLHPCLKRLSEYDSSAGVKLMPTLRSLVHNHGNRFLTAAELGIQRNTLQYRLEKIASVCEIDISDEQVFDHISLSVWLLEYQDGFSNAG